MSNDVKTMSLLDPSGSIAGEYVKSFEYPWLALTGLKDYVNKLISDFSDNDDFYFVGEGVLAAKDASIAENATIIPPTFIDKGAEIRPGAYIRGSAIVGKGAVVGNSSEVKNAILFDKAQIPHFNYVGDSILGSRSHMGAGAITSNLKMDKTNISIKTAEGRIDTGMRKIGAILGDGVEVGCGCVLNPGTVIGKNSNVYPITSVRGAIPAYSIVKDQNTIVKKELK